MVIQLLPTAEEERIDIIMKDQEAASQTGKEQDFRLSETFINSGGRMVNRGSSLECSGASSWQSSQ